MPRVSRRRDGKLMTAEERAIPDHGADGPAQLARRSEVREWKATGTTAKRMLPTEQHRETYPLDHYERASLLTEREMFAGRRLAFHYARGFGFQNVTAKLDGGGPSQSDERAQSQTACRRAYDEAMHAAPVPCQWVLREVVRGEWPTQMRALSYLRVGLGAIADYWGLPRVVTPARDDA